MNAVITDMIWHDISLLALLSSSFFYLFTSSPLMLTCTSLQSRSTAPLQCQNPPQLYVCSQLQLLSDWCLSLPDLTHSSVKQLLAISLRCDSDMCCSALMSETQWTQTQTQQLSTELFDTGVIQTNYHFRVIQAQEPFRSDTSICLAVMFSTCKTLKQQPFNNVTLWPYTM
jgi:hypothetical protein